MILYFIFAAVLMIVSLLVLRQVHQKYVIYSDNHGKIGLVVAVIVASLCWFFVLPTVIIGGTLYFVVTTLARILP